VKYFYYSIIVITMISDPTYLQIFIENMIDTIIT